MLALKIILKTPFSVIFVLADRDKEKKGKNRNEGAGVTTSIFFSPPSLSLSLTRAKVTCVILQTARLFFFCRTNRASVFLFFLLFFCVWETL